MDLPAGSELLLRAFAGAMTIFCKAWSAWILYTDDPKTHTLDRCVDFKVFLMAEDEVRLLAIKINIPDLKKCKLGKYKRGE